MAVREGKRKKYGQTSTLTSESDEKEPPGVRVNVGRYANRVLSFDRKPEIF
jgi:hypothetical protein